MKTQLIPLRLKSRTAAKMLIVCVGILLGGCQTYIEVGEGARPSPEFKWAWDKGKPRKAGADDQVLP